MRPVRDGCMRYTGLAGGVESGAHIECGIVRSDPLMDVDKVS